YTATTEIYTLSLHDALPISPMYSTWWWRNRYDNNQPVRHHADNVTILSFDRTGKLQWSNVIHKEQFDDEGDERISYQMANTGSRSEEHTSELQSQSNLVCRL